MSRYIRSVTTKQNIAALLTKALRLGPLTSGQLARRLGISQNRVLTALRTHDEFAPKGFADKCAVKWGQSDEFRNL